MTALRAILHVDMDAFFASVEQRDHPELRGKPLLVGGDGPRGVVAAASYEAREYGCHSAQPMAVAKRACPNAVIVPPRGGRYHDVSTAVFELLERFTPIVEPLSIDEAFLDVTGSQRLFGSPREIAASIRACIRAELNLTASVGVAPNKFLAKLASDLHKPDGLTVIEPGEIEATLGSLPIGRMWGVGPATEKRLTDLGITTFGDLHSYPLDVLESILGTWAGRMAALARGEDHRTVTPDSRAKSISHEQTFGQDLQSPEAVVDVMRGQAESVARRLRRHAFRAGTVTVKVRYGDFETITRSASFDEPTDRTDVLWRQGRALFDAWAHGGWRPVRLIGFGTSNLSRGTEQLNLFTDDDDQRRRALDEATDSIKQRFGSGAIHRGTREQHGLSEGGRLPRGVQREEPDA